MIPPLLTADLPGTGGVVRRDPEDFIVEELPLYPALGVGDHVHCRVEKVGISTREAVRRLARHLKIAEGRFGTAGRKDARAVARQTISVERIPPADLEGLELPGLRVLATKRHRNKLRTGHLRGNRFVIRVRDVVPDALERAEAVLSVLRGRGLPNGFGEQRFGHARRNHLVGAALVRGDAVEALSLLLGRPTEAEGDPRLADARARYDAGDVQGAFDAFPPSHGTERRCLERLLRGAKPGSALRSIPRGGQRFLVSALQSALFNEVLAARMDTLDTLLPGDLAWIHGKGAVFRVDDPEAESHRCAALEISPSGPMFGTKLLAPGGHPGEMEAAVLAAHGLTPEKFEVAGVGRFEGERRPLRVPVEDLSMRIEDGDLELSFILPRGSYATALLAEVTKGSLDAVPEDADD